MVASALRNNIGTIGTREQLWRRANDKVIPNERKLVI